MLTIRPFSDLRNHFSDIEKTINEGETVYLTKMAIVQWLL